VAGLSAVRSLRQQLTGIALSEDARFNIDARLKTKEDEFSQAAVLAHGLRIEVLADDGLVVPTQEVRVSVIVGARDRTFGGIERVRRGRSVPNGPSAGERRLPL
jgi:hypothetical protein